MIPSLTEAVKSDKDVTQQRLFHVDYNHWNLLLPTGDH